MAQEETIKGAAEKISGLLNPKQDNQVPEKKEAAPSEQPEKIEQETSKESQSKSEETPKEVATDLAASFGSITLISSCDHPFFNQPRMSAEPILPHPTKSILGCLFIDYPVIFIQKTQNYL